MNPEFKCYDSTGQELSMAKKFIWDAFYAYLTFGFPDLQASPGLASYYVKCTGTAWAAEDATVSANSIRITMELIGPGTLLHDTTVALPTITDGAIVTATKIMFDIAQDTLLTSKTIASILKKAADVTKTIDATFTIDRFLVLEQKLVEPSPEASVAALATETTVVLSARVLGLSVADATTLADSIAPALATLGYSATISAEKSSVMTKCEAECGGEDCGKCLDGRACEVADDCFSTCEVSVCKVKPNSAVTASIIAAVMFAALACVLIM
jgi:hypothetical protein